jgi:hypothetical protein
MRNDAMTERDKVMDILRQLELHAPIWVRKIRAYIIKIEKRGMTNE